MANNLTLKQQAAMRNSATQNEVELIEEIGGKSSQDTKIEVETPLSSLREKAPPSMVLKRSTSEVNDLKVIIISEREFFPSELQTLQSLGKLVVYSEKLNNVNINELNFNFFCVVISDTSRQWLGLNLNKTQIPVISVSHSKRDESLWIKDVGSIKILKELPEASVDLFHYFQVLFSKVINKPESKWLVFLKQVISLLTPLLK